MSQLETGLPQLRLPKWASLVPSPTCSVATDARHDGRSERLLDDGMRARDWRCQRPQTLPTRQPCSEVSSKPTASA